MNYYQLYAAKFDCNSILVIIFLNNKFFNMFINNYHITEKGKIINNRNNIISRIKDKICVLRNDLFEYILTNIFYLKFTLIKNKYNSDKLFGIK